ncbi:hypothetical protein D3520_09700 [Listeria monocytogenes]|nr:hypothetical protein [Listeria monocytogenes]
MNQGIDVINYLEKIVRTKNVISVKKLTELTRTFNTNFEDDFNASLHCEQLRYVIESSLSYYEKFFDYLI